MEWGIGSKSIIFVNKIILPIMRIFSFFIALFFICINGFSQSQEELVAKAKEIVKEANEIYNRERASWVATDILLKETKGNFDNMGGYFSYPDVDGTIKCIFFSNTAPVKVLYTMSTDTLFKVKKFKIDKKAREFTSMEKDIYDLRKASFDRISSDTTFKLYKKTEMNVVPIINGNTRKAYVLTATSVNGTVLFGNDYLITFDKNNTITEIEKLHSALIPMEYATDKKAEKEDPHGGIHTHLPGKSPYMTPTDICTARLYKEYTKWKELAVVSEKYSSLYLIDTNALIIIPKSFFRDQKQK